MLDLFLPEEVVTKRKIGSARGHLECAIYIKTDLLSVFLLVTCKPVQGKNIFYITDSIALSYCTADRQPA
jgi:hypothetical protein